MAATNTDLYRRGNADGPRMTNVRVGKDIITSIQNGIEVAQAHSGGVSTFSLPGPGRNWWVLGEGFELPDEISVINDHGNHYSWEPNIDMPLADFVALLATVEPGFIKVS